MKRVDSVISLIYSLSKSEKKHFSLQVIKDKEEKDYLVIYDIVCLLYTSDAADEL